MAGRGGQPQQSRGAGQKQWRGGRGGIQQHYANKSKQQNQMSQSLGVTVSTTVAGQNGQQVRVQNVNSLKSVNPLNQYYIEQFIKLKKDADFKNLRNQSFCYKRVIIALSKYPMPILCAQQCQFLEGVGDTVAHKFTQMIQDREKEYEDGLFFGGLAHDQKKKKQVKNQKLMKYHQSGQEFGEDFKDDDYKFDENVSGLSDHDHILQNFAGIQLNHSSRDKANKYGTKNPEPLNMSLKQYLVAQDKLNFLSNFGNSAEKSTISTKKKVKRRQPVGSDEEDMFGGFSEDDETKISVKKLKIGESDFLDIGSTSWSMMLALYFLTLHDDSQDACCTFESIQEMIEVLKQEFGDMIPFVSGLEKLIKEGPFELQKFREHSFLELVDQTVRDPFQWRMLMTQKGIKRAKGLCKSVGLLVNLEVDLNDKSRNKITINMYDKHLMPIVEDLYYTDQTQQVRTMKHDGGLKTDSPISGANMDLSYIDKQTEFFKDFIISIENEVMESMGSNNLVSDMIGNQNKKLVKTDKQIEEEKQADVTIMAGLFDDGNRFSDMEDDQDLDIVNPKSKKAPTKTKNIGENMKMEIKPKQAYNTFVPKRKNMFQIMNQEFNKFCDSEVILIVDNREKRNNQDVNYFYDRFLASGIKTELKSLPLGDFLWVLRIKNDLDDYEEEGIEEINNPDPDQQDENAGKKIKKKKVAKKKKPKKMAQFTDYVLDFIVERKTADDLAASIMDGRYEEQKFRLKNCGINNVIYLVEGTPGQYCKIPEAVLRKACIHTQIFHGFNVMRLPTIQESLKWLTAMTNETSYRMNLTKKQMARQFENRIKDTLIDFKQFQSESSKNSNLNVQQIFARQLRTVKGLGIDNCSAITRVFKTPLLLSICYDKCDESDLQKENLLNAGKLELMKNQYAYKDQINQVSCSAFDLQEFIPADELGNPDLPKTIDDVDKINLINVISSSIPKFYNRLHKEFSDAVGVPVRKVNKTQVSNMKKLFCQRGRYED